MLVVIWRVISNQIRVGLLNWTGNSCIGMKEDIEIKFQQNVSSILMSQFANGP